LFTGNTPATAGLPWWRIQDNAKEYMVIKFVGISQDTTHGMQQGNYRGAQHRSAIYTDNVEQLAQARASAGFSSDSQREGLSIYHY